DRGKWGRLPTRGTPNLPARSVRLFKVRRSSILWLHRWVALIFVPFLLLQAVTGAILVIHDATMVPNPHGLRPAISVTTFTSAATRALPGYHVTRLFMP